MIYVRLQEIYRSQSGSHLSILVRPGITVGETRGFRNETTILKDRRGSQTFVRKSSTPHGVVATHYYSSFSPGFT
ncbi:hypothetical protein Belba_2103 [Belliella baltica DSM 15883]|uniref:Uncharacterized protein n=1 Tax=Belliella baltica (strain DSM 15883 / CIP 108006 / LMG 21964 / BA134) TaxID=866536 RepID=I3Z603_BELBD|nr:hypothetical protein Belba_2103 [Belliella baltica DSM 15883]